MYTGGDMWNAIIFFLLLFLPFQFSVNAFFGSDVAVFRMLIPCVFVFFLFDIVRRKKPISFQSGELIGLCLVFLSITLGIVLAPHEEWALRKAFFLVEFFMWFFMISSLVRNKLLHKKTIIAGIVWGGAGAALVGIFQWGAQFFFGLEKILVFWGKEISPFFLGEAFSQTVSKFSSWLVNIQGETIFRAIGVFPDPHTFAFFLEICFFWALFAFLGTGRKKYLVLTVVCGLGIALSFSRGAYVGLIVSGLLFLFFFPKVLGISKKKGISLVLSVFFLFFAVAWTQNGVRERLGDTFLRMDTSGEERIILWQAAFDVWKENFIFGAGFSGFPEKVQPSAQYRDPIYAHNMYLDIAVETGLFGLLLFFWASFWAVRRFLLFGKKDSVYYGGFFALVCLGAHGFFDMPLYSVQVMGVLCATLALAEKDT